MNTDIILYYAIITVMAYFIGSIPIGFIVGKIAGLGDIRNTGSGNIGATNMVRAGGKKLGALTLLLDAGKAVLVVWLMYGFIAPYMDDCNYHKGEGIYGFYVDTYITGLCAVIGHCYPVWLKFKGGKGVATGLGLMGAVHSFVPPDMWWLIIIFPILWLGIYTSTKMVSVASLVTFAALPIFTLISYGIWVVPLLVTMLITLRHKDNIIRVLNGEEHGFRASR